MRKQFFLFEERKILWIFPISFVMIKASLSPFSVKKTQIGCDLQLDMNDNLLSMIKIQYGSRYAFAKHLGIPYSSLRNMLAKGIDNFPVGTYIKICNALDIPWQTMLEASQSDNQHILVCTDTEEVILAKLRETPELYEMVLRLLDIKQPTD